MKHFMAIFAASFVAGCEASDSRPIAAFAALPGKGDAIPDFSFPSLRDGPAISLASLRDKPAVVAIWDTHCPFARAVIDELKALEQRYGAREAAIVVLSGDNLDDLTAFEDSARTGLQFAVAGSALRESFDRSATAPERAEFRVEWVPPLFLLLDRNGRVVARDGGAGFSERLRPVLDSLLTASLY